MKHAEAGLRPATDRSVILVMAFLLAAYAAASLFGLTTAGAHGGEHPEVSVAPHYWSIAPFALLLGAIAVLPLLSSTSHWWEHNLSKAYVAVSLALITLVYLAFLHPAGSIGAAGQTLRHTILADYIPFIVLLFSLYTISGGIRISGDLPAHALTNAAFMAVGGLLASFIGTTGAAMLLVRPLLETNSQRKFVKHTLVFFIFVVCNCGGLLLPLGDPPLFLGYLNGVSFLWTLSLWKSWLFVNGSLLAVYVVWDHFFCYPREAKTDLARDETQVRPLRIAGLWPNAILLAGVVFSVGLLDSSQAFPGTAWHPNLYLREAVQLGLVLLSLLLGAKTVRESNQFDYVAIVEVATLFVGIFVCMQPALQILHLEGAQLGVNSPQRIFWATGWLSAMLDNAPTYVVFFQTASALATAEPWASAPKMAGVPLTLLTAISLGSVCMGAMTYIGNGPNFMVKTIAEKAGVPMPSFFGYMLYSLGVLLPILVVNNWLFL